MRGYGDSEKPLKLSQYDLDILIKDLKGIIEALGYKKCVLVCHDWGACIGFWFVRNHMNMVSKYVMMGAPAVEAWGKIVLSEWDQFKKSWYIFFFQMPFMPEFVSSLNDYALLKQIGSGKISDTFTEEDLEAYKYTFSKEGTLF